MICFCGDSYIEDHKILNTPIPLRNQWWQMSVEPYGPHTGNDRCKKPRPTIDSCDSSTNSES
jgi:hypothetical protein